MRRALTLFAAMLALAVLAGGAPAQAGPRLALVIGNSAYAGAPALPGCAGSANVVAAALKRAGFDVTQLSDSSNAQMGNAISSFADAAAAAPDTVAIAYLCGYAIGYDGRLFLLPASAKLLRDTDVLTQGVVGRLFASSVVRSGARAGAVLMDLVAQPGAAALPLDGLVAPSAIGPHALAAVQTLGPMPAGPSLLSAAVAQGLTATNLDARGFLDGIKDALAGRPQLALVTVSPTAPARLNGEPAKAVAPPVAAAPAPPLPPPSVPAVSGELATLSDLDRRQVQLALKKLGYYAGTVDGVYGAESAAAIRRFQHELGADMTGRLTTDQARRLLGSAG